MYVYILKKILLLIPAMFMLAVIVFFLSEMAPGDKVLAYLDVKGASGFNQKDNISEKDYYEIAKFLHLDLPAFYFSVHPAVIPGDLYKIIEKNKRKLAKSLYLKSGSRVLVDRYFKDFEDIKQAFDMLSGSSENNDAFNELATILDKIKDAGDFRTLKEYISKLKSFLSGHSSFLDAGFTKRITKLIEDFEAIEHSGAGITAYLPVISWYGTANRFHIWFGNLLKFDLGISAVDGRSISDKIAGALRWTLLYMVVAYILTFGLAIILGLYGAYFYGGRITKFLDWMFAAFYSMPLFWLATLAVIFLASGELTDGYRIFPAPGIGEVRADMSWHEQIFTALPHLLLPSIVVAIHSGAYLSSLLKKNMLDEMKKRYYLAFLAKGLDKKKVIIRHILPNAIMPLITVFIVGFPASLAGSVVTEVIFNIPGMGRLFYDSVLSYDWYVVYAIVLLIGVATYVSYTAGDIVYALLNPKIRIA